MNRRAFTLVELLVVIAIVGLLSTVAVVSTNAARVKARDTQRKANLVQISKALDLYYNDNGAYPSTGGIANWQGAATVYGGFPDTGATWIPGLTPTYMASLPHDPDTNKPKVYCLGAPTGASYIYTSNGTDYKLLAYCTPESPNTGSDPMGDPARVSGTYAVYTPGARNW